MKIYPRVNRQKGTVKVEVKLENVDAYLRPDMSVRINFMADVPETNGVAGAPQVVVPKIALRGRGEETFVWTVREEQLRRLVVQVGAELGGTVQITSGLNGGEALVISEAENLKEGIQVHVSDG